MFFFFKQKTAYEMRISDWSSDVCSSDLGGEVDLQRDLARGVETLLHRTGVDQLRRRLERRCLHDDPVAHRAVGHEVDPDVAVRATDDVDGRRFVVDVVEAVDVALRGVVLELVRPFRGDFRRGYLDRAEAREEEHTS